MRTRMVRCLRSGLDCAPRRTTRFRARPGPIPSHCRWRTASPAALGPLVGFRWPSAFAGVCACRKPNSPRLFAFHLGRYAIGSSIAAIRIKRRKRILRSLLGSLTSYAGRWRRTQQRRLDDHGFAPKAHAVDALRLRLSRTASRVSQVRRGAWAWRAYEPMAHVLHSRLARP